MENLNNNTNELKPYPKINTNQTSINLTSLNSNLIKIIFSYIDDFKIHSISLKNTKLFKIILSET